MADVLLHGLRHLKFQIGPWGDAEIAAAMDRNWRRHLHALKPALATHVQRTARRMSDTARRAASLPVPGAQ